MPRVDTALLVVASCISSQFKDLSRQVFQDGGKVYWRIVSRVTLLTGRLGNVPGAPDPMRLLMFDLLNIRWMRLTGNWRPALVEREVDLESSFLTLPLALPLPLDFAEGMVMSV